MAGPATASAAARGRPAAGCRLRTTRSSNAGAPRRRTSDLLPGADQTLGSFGGVVVGRWHEADLTKGARAALEEAGGGGRRRRGVAGAEDRHRLERRGRLRVQGAEVGERALAGVRGG